MNYATDRLDRRARVADSSKSSSSSPSSLWIDFQEGLRLNDHERIACSLKDAGWNSHAIFHYAQAWMLQPDNPQAAADYCQMVELAGYPVTALIGVFVFRSRVIKLRTPAERRTMGDVAIDCPAVANNPMWLLEGGDERQHQHCGCGQQGCGASECYFVVDDHPLTIILDAVHEYAATMQSRYHQGKDVISAHHILGAISKVKRCGRSHQPDLCSTIDPPLPALFMFWDDVRNKQSNFRTLPVPFQLLTLKLFYLVIPAVAIEAVVRMTIDDASLPQRYKSHRAFYVFIHSLTLGERIKPGRRQHLKFDHEPLWDRLWDSKRPISCSPHGFFLDQFDQLLRALSEGRGTEHTIPPIWLPPPFSTEANPLYFLGDSHVLSLAWQTLTLPNSNRNLVVVPTIVTGLKAWHVQKTTRFFTQTCLQGWLKRLPESAPIAVSAGEIDCREGMGGPLLQGYTTTCHAQVQATVRAYIAALDSCGRTIAVLPVAPHVHRKGGRVAGQVARRSAMRVWNTELSTLLSPQQGKDVGRLVLLDYSDQLVLNSDLNEIGYTLNPLFNADGTHMNAAFAPLLVDALMNCAERNICFRQQLGL